MAEIHLVRQDARPMDGPAADAARDFLFGVIDGLGEVNRKKWRGFFKRLLKMEPGEVVEIRTHQARIGWYHRKHLNLEHKLFEAQERFEDFDQFRMWLKVGAGHVDWLPGPKGGVIPVPKSISYANMEQADFEAYHEKVMVFLRQEHAARTLWKQLTPMQQTAMMEDVIARCGGDQM